MPLNMRAALDRLANAVDPMTPKERQTFETLLEIWRDFHCRDDHRTGFNGKDSILQSDGAKDTQQLYDGADYVVYLAVDACLSDLESFERQAIYVIKRVARKWRELDMDFAAALRMGEASLLAKMKRNSETAIFFY